jgi:hypothetical protein
VAGDKAKAAKAKTDKAKAGKAKAGKSEAKRKLTTTVSHPFWSQTRKAWVKAGDLRAGELLKTSAGTYVQVSAVRSYTDEKRTYDLTIDDLHTYYVLAGSTPLLVHNCGGSVGGHKATCGCSTGGTPVGPRNAKLAGGNHPKTSVPFDSQGFPDFAGHTDPSVPDVFITLTGDPKKDFRLADKAAGIDENYRKGTWTWHHHQNCGQMQLVDMAIHAKTGHTGGASIC